MILTILVFLLILSVLVLIHEAGHYFVAKWLNIKVEEFGFGFPPKAFGFKRGETEYTINWLPIGGFVKLFGEDDAGGGKVSVQNPKLKVKSSEVGRAFFSRPVWQRAAVVVAGVVMNVLLAAVLFYSFLHISSYKTELPLLTDHKFAFVQQTNYNMNPNDSVISVISKNSPAEQAGIQAPAVVLSLNDKPVVNRKEFVNTINANKGKKIALRWKDLKTNTEHSGFVTPRVSPPKDEGPLGVGFFPIAILNYESPMQKFFSGFAHTYNVTAYTIDVMVRLVQVAFEQKTAAPVSEGVSGPFGIGALVGEILQLPSFKEKLLGILNLAGLLSVSLAFFNILPIPALDGGRLFFILIEGISGKKVNARFESLAHTVGMILLLAMMAALTFRDLSRILMGNSPFGP